MAQLMGLSKKSQEQILQCQLEWHPDVIKEAKLYADALSESDVSQSLLAMAIGRKRSYIANVLRLLQLPDTVQSLLSKGSLSFSQGRVVLRAMPESQERLAQECVRSKWTVRELEAHLKNARPSEPELKKAAHQLYKDKGLISQIQINDKGNCFIRFAFRSHTEAREFLQKLEKLQ